MAPVVCSDDNSSTDHKHLLFEASILHRIPPELFIQSSSTRYLQSFPNGEYLTIKYKSSTILKKMSRLERMAWQEINLFRTLIGEIA